MFTILKALAITCTLLILDVSSVKPLIWKCYCLLYNQVLNKIKIAVRNFVMKGAYISMTNVWLMYDVTNLL